MKGSRHISVYLNDQAESDMLKAKAALAGLSLSNYMRKRAGLDPMQVGQGMKGINRHKRSVGATLDQTEAVEVEVVDSTEPLPTPMKLDPTPSHLEFSIDESEPVVEVSTAIM